MFISTNGDLEYFERFLLVSMLSSILLVQLPFELATIALLKVNKSINPIILLSWQTKLPWQMLQQIQQRYRKRMGYELNMPEPNKVGKQESSSLPVNRWTRRYTNTGESFHLIIKTKLYGKLIFVPLYQAICLDKPRSSQANLNRLSNGHEWIWKSSRMKSKIGGR